MSTPLDRSIETLARSGMTRFFLRMFDDAPELLLKNLTVEAVGPDRTFKIGGKWLRNFGSDSFLGLDQHPAVLAAIERGVREWGAHNGTSRAFSEVAPQGEAEARVAAWLGTEDAVIYPSVTLANVGALPALTTRHDVVVLDQYAHNSIEEGARVAKARGVRTAKFAHNDPADLDRVLRSLRPFRHAVVAVDGVYSMSGRLPPLADFQRVAREYDGFLYVDDAHATGVVGTGGRGTVADALGDYENTLVVGSLSKAVSCLGGFVAGTRDAVEVLKMRSNSLIFGGPVPPPYLTAVCAALDVITSPEYAALRSKLDANVAALVAGASDLGFTVLGGQVPIVSVLIGAEETTLRAGRFLFDAGYYVQSVVFPAVPHGAGVLRMQVNANHPAAAVDGLVGALAELRATLPDEGHDAPLLVPARREAISA